MEVVDRGADEVDAHRGQRGRAAVVEDLDRRVRVEVVEADPLPAEHDAHVPAVAEPAPEPEAEAVAVLAVVGKDPVAVEGVGVEGDVGLEEMRIAERDRVVADLGAGRDREVEGLPRARNARPWTNSEKDIGTSAMSKFRCVSEISPKMPLSEPSPTPKLTLPVSFSFTSMSRSRMPGEPGRGSWIVARTSLKRLI